MKEYTPSEKSTEELREYIAKLTEESEHIVLPRYVAALGLCGVVV